MVVALVVSLFWSGINYGWAALELVLRRADVYSEYGPVEQTVRLNLVMTISMFVLRLAGLPAGVVLDIFGPRWTMLASGAIALLGCYLFGFEVRGRAWHMPAKHSVAPINQIQLEVGYSLFALSGMLVLLATCTSRTVPSRHTHVYACHRVLQTALGTCTPATRR